MAPRSQRAPSPASVWLVWCCAVGCSVPVTVSGDRRTDGGAGQSDGGNTSLPGVVEIAPGGATFVGRQMVTLKSSAGRRIHYTVDGTAPTLESPVYAGPLVLDGPAQVRALVDGGLQAPGATA